MPLMRTITSLALAALLVVGAASVSAEGPSTQPADAQALLQASPSPVPSLLSLASPPASAVPSVDPCASPHPTLSPEPGASVVPVSPAASVAPASPSPSVAAASIAPGSPAPSAVPSFDPCASPEPTEGREGFVPGRVKVTLDKIADDLDLPTYVTGTGDGRLFVTLREGQVLILDPETGRTKRFLDIRDRVDTFGERGLHAIALDPGYARNGRFYVHYNSADGDTNIVRFTGKPGDGPVKKSSAKTILRLNQPYENHNGGWIGFGPDRKLYVALGDGGGNDPGDPLGNGQDKGQPLAKILRVDPQSRRYSTYAWGLRNPWRASFDRQTGDLWIGDVGQKEIEEIDIVKAGRDNPPNFGWSVMEGSQCHRGRCDRSKFVLPVTEYRHGADGCSVVGGYVYRGEAQPLLKGAYLFSDFCSMKIWAVKASDGKPGADLRWGPPMGRRW